MGHDYQYEEDYGGRVLWGRVAFYLGTLLLAFLLGTCAGGDGVPRSQLVDANNEIKELVEERERLRQRVAALEAGAETPQEGTTEAGADATEATEPAAGDAGADDETRIYVVRPGDTLRQISQRFYNDPNKFDLIADANSIDRDNPLHVGQELKIPPAEE